MTQGLRRLVAMCVLVGAVVGIPLVASAFTAPGNPSGYVNDFASVLDASQKSALEEKLATFNASTSNEIAVVTIKSLDGDYIEHYAVELFKAWGIGKDKKDNGVLLLVALDDHKIRIEVGYGLEGALTDSISAQIIRDDLTPAFKQNHFYEGIDKAVDDMISVTQGEYSASTPETKNTSGGSLETIFFICVLVFQFFVAILARSKSWWAGGVLGGVAGIILTAIGFLGMSVIVGGILTVVLIFLGALFDYIVSSGYSSSVRNGTSIPWWAGGGGFGGRSSGGSSFGGFGGGSSGGGGASGGW